MSLEQNTKVIFIQVKNKEKVYIPIKMVVFIWEIGNIIRNTDMVNFIVLNKNKFMMENGKKINQLELEFKFGTKIQDA